jgi:hypothetical protein
MKTVKYNIINIDKIYHSAVKAKLNHIRYAHLLNLGSSIECFKFTKIKHEKTANNWIVWKTPFIGRLTIFTSMKVININNIVNASATNKLPLSIYFKPNA